MANGNNSIAHNNIYIFLKIIFNFLNPFETICSKFLFENNKQFPIDSGVWNKILRHVLNGNNVSIYRNKQDKEIWAVAILVLSAYKERRNMLQIYRK